MKIAAKAPDDCATMAELRVEIDALDDDLITLLARRSQYIDRAVILKTREGLPARTTDRVAAVLTRIREAARAEGLDPVLAEDLWSTLIEWGIARESAAMTSDSE